MSYSVLWSENGELSPKQKRKTFEFFQEAQWFAKEMKKSYNWVMCVETKNLKEY
jgi:hypothetical protein